MSNHRLYMGKGIWVRAYIIYGQINARPPAWQLRSYTNARMQLNFIQFLKKAIKIAT